MVKIGSNRNGSSNLEHLQAVLVLLPNMQPLDQIIRGTAVNGTEGNQSMETAAAEQGHDSI